MSQSPNDSHPVQIRKQIAREPSRIRAIDGGVCNAATDHTALHTLHTLPHRSVILIQRNLERRDFACCNGSFTVANRTLFFLIPLLTGKNFWRSIPKAIPLMSGGVVAPWCLGCVLQLYEKVAILGS